MTNTLTTIEHSHSQLEKAEDSSRLPAFKDMYELYEYMSDHPGALERHPRVEPALQGDIHGSVIANKIGSDHPNSGRITFYWDPELADIVSAVRAAENDSSFVDSLSGIEKLKYKVSPKTRRNIGHAAATISGLQWGGMAFEAIHPALYIPGMLVSAGSLLYANHKVNKFLNQHTADKIDLSAEKLVIGEGLTIMPENYRVDFTAEEAERLGISKKYNVTEIKRHGSTEREFRYDTDAATIANETLSALDPSDNDAMEKWWEDASEIALLQEQLYTFKPIEEAADEDVKPNYPELAEYTKARYKKDKIFEKKSESELVAIGYEDIEGRIREILRGMVIDTIENKHMNDVKNAIESFLNIPDELLGPRETGTANLKEEKDIGRAWYIAHYEQFNHYEDVFALYDAVSSSILHVDDITQLSARGIEKIKNEFIINTTNHDMKYWINSLSEYRTDEQREKSYKSFAERVKKEIGKEVELPDWEDFRLRLSNI